MEGDTSDELGASSGGSESWRKLGKNGDKTLERYTFRQVTLLQQYA
jgi:hypothetical protein